jgi:hypothetical protein
MVEVCGRMDGDIKGVEYRERRGNSLSENTPFLAKRSGFDFRCDILLNSELFEKVDNAMFIIRWIDGY